MLPNQKGLSIIFVLLVMAISSIILAGFTNDFYDLSQQRKFLRKDLRDRANGDQILLEKIKNSSEPMQIIENQQRTLFLESSSNKIPLWSELIQSIPSIVCPQKLKSLCSIKNFNIEGHLRISENVFIQTANIELNNKQLQQQILIFEGDFIANKIIINSKFPVFILAFGTIQIDSLDRISSVPLTLYSQTGRIQIKNISDIYLDCKLANADSFIAAEISLNGKVLKATSCPLKLPQKFLTDKKLIAEFWR
jgi:hypothetical protein